MLFSCATLSSAAFVSPSVIQSQCRDVCIGKRYSSHAGPRPWRFRGAEKGGDVQIFFRRPFSVEASADAVFETVTIQRAVIVGLAAAIAFQVNNIYEDAFAGKVTNQAEIDRTDPSMFWEFALQHYTKSGKLLVQLETRYGSAASCDSNVLLYLCWAASVGYPAITDTPTLQAARDWAHRLTQFRSAIAEAAATKELAAAAAPVAKPSPEKKNKRGFASSASPQSASSAGPSVRGSTAAAAAAASGGVDAWAVDSEIADARALLDQIPDAAPAPEPETISTQPSAPAPPGSPPRPAVPPRPVDMFEQLTAAVSSMLGRRSDKQATEAAQAAQRSVSRYLQLVGYPVGVWEQQAVSQVLAECFPSADPFACQLPITATPTSPRPALDFTSAPDPSLVSTDINVVVPQLDLSQLNLDAAIAKAAEQIVYQIGDSPAQMEQVLAELKRERDALMSK